MIEDAHPVLRDYERFYYYVQGLDMVYSYSCKKHSDAKDEYAQKIVQEIGAGDRSRREDELKRESFYKKKIFEFQNELREKETQLKKLREENMRKEKLIEELKEKEIQPKKPREENFEEKNKIEKKTK